jgi:large subunit ribosomal protein L1
VNLIADETYLKAVQQALEQGKAQDRKFKQTVELALNLKNVDLSIPKNRIDEDVPLPHGRGKDARIGIFASGETAVQARKVADTVITPEELDELAKNKRQAKKLANDHTYFISEAPLMTTIGKTLGTVLGPRGKMPRPVPPNFDPTGMVSNLRGTVKVRSKQSSTFHCPIGTEDMDPEQLAANAQEVVRRVQSKLEMGDQNIRSVFVKTTMGPAVRVI